MSVLMTAETVTRATRAADAVAVFRDRRAVLFDLDGTLYGGRDAAAYFAHADDVTGLRVRARLGASSPRAGFDALEALRLSDRTYRSKSEALERGLGIGLAEMNRFRERFTDPETLLVADPRTARLLVSLSRRFRLVLGTNNTPRLARRILATLGVDPQVFAAILTSEDAGVAKPDARFFAAAARLAGVALEELVSAGDRPESDLDPATALGAGVWRVDSPLDLYALEALVADETGS
jgi:FMN phosphatase YigB (HAD superfamily)